MLGFDFADVEMLSISHFMEKTEFRTKAMRAAMGRINAEKEKNKKVKIDVFASAVTGYTFNPHVDRRKRNIRYVRTETLKHLTF